MSQTVTPSHSGKYPPVGQARTGIATQYEVHYADGVLRMTGGMAKVASCAESLPTWPTSTTSILSGEPGYLLKTDVLELALTAQEMYRLLRHNLRPDEFFQLAETFGIFPEISGKFYGEELGIAIDPLYNEAEVNAREQVSKLPHLFAVQDATGMLYPHSILTQRTGDEMRRTWLRQGILTRTLPLRPLDGKNYQSVTLFENVVGIVEAAGEVQAHGPFRTSRAWRDWQKATEENGPPARYTSGKVAALFAENAP